MLIKNEMKKLDKYQIAIIVIIAVGVLIRIINLTTVPNGLNTDEASAGYEAYAIGNYGIDRNGNFLPVFLKAWGNRTKCTLYIFDDTICKNFRIVTFIS